MNLRQLERFEDKVWRTDTCWRWLGSTDKDGYALFRIGKTNRGARISYEHYVGPIPEGYEIDHLWKQKDCVNPFHLEAVTHKVNISRQEHNNQNKNKKSCNNGHEFTEKNTLILANGDRQCRKCSRDRQRKHRRSQANTSKQP